MKYRLMVIAIISFFSSLEFASAQKLIFCDKVDAAGNAINASAVFTVPGNGGPVTLLFNLPSNQKVTSVNFDLYKIVEGKEVYQSTLKEPVSNSWVSKKVTLYDEGKYRVYVFDEKDQQLSKGEFSIKK